MEQPWPPMTAASRGSSRNRPPAAVSAPSRPRRPSSRSSSRSIAGLKDQRLPPNFSKFCLSVPQSHYLAATAAAASSSRRGWRSPRRLLAPTLAVPPAEKPVRDDDKRESLANSDTLLAFPEDDERDKAAAEDEAKASAQDKGRGRPPSCTVCCVICKHRRI